MPSPKKKQALGRGLNALMSEAQTETGNVTSDTLVDITKLSDSALDEELDKGYQDMKCGRTTKAKEVFANINKDYQL